MLFSWLYVFCSSLLLCVVLIVSCMLLVVLSAYMITLPSLFLAALPTICSRLLVFRKNPSLSASRIATNSTSGRSIPSRKRFIPTSTSKSPARSWRRISVRSIVSISLCK